MTAASKSGAAAYYGTPSQPAAVSAAGGQYRLCWCAGLDHQCEAPEDFRVDLGRLTLVGVSPLTQDRTCVAGQTCVLDNLVGRDLSADDHVLLLDTCGVDDLVEKYAAKGWSSATTLAWRNQVVSSKGGQYRMCWCSDLSGVGADCLEAASFKVDIGTLNLMGIAPLSQHRTCVSGQTCHLDGFTGYLLDAGGNFLVLDTCGTDSMVPAFPALNLREVPVSAAGGQYRLCWCADDVSCDSPEAFIVDAGELRLVGPSELMQHRTCVSGRTCSFGSLVGQHLADGDALLVLDTCGTSSGVVPRFSGAAADGGAGHSSQVAIGGASVSWGSTAPSSQGGVYRLCWCAAGFTCDVPESFRTDLGQLHLVGPAPLTQGRTCVSGQTCRLDGALGESLSTDDRVVVLDTCGALGAAPARFPAEGFDTGKGSIPSGTVLGASWYSWGTTEVTAQGGEYRLCWCAASTGPCNTVAEFRTDFGELRLVGPYPLQQDRRGVLSFESDL